MRVIGAAWVAAESLSNSALARWMTSLKSANYFLFPRAHQRVMPAAVRPEKKFRVIGVVMTTCGIGTGYDAFFWR